MNQESGRFEELIRRARQGDRDAVGELLEKHRDQLRTIAQKRISGKLAARIDASDVIQQTCLSVFGNLDRFQGSEEAEFVAWIQKIHEQNVQNAIRDHTTAQKRDIRREESRDAGDGPSAALAQSDQTTASQHAVRREEAAQLEQMLERLAEDQCEVVRLRHLEGWSLAQIAEHTQRSESAVVGLLKRGMQNLRTYIKHEQ